MFKAQLLMWLFYVFLFATDYAFANDDHEESFFKDFNNEQIFLRVTSDDLSDEAIGLIAEMAEPVELFVRDMDEFEVRKKQICGEQPIAFDRLIENLNIDKVENLIKAEKKIILPACAYIGPPIEYEISPNETLTEVAYNRIGTIRANVLDAITNASEIANANLISPGSSVTLPFTTEPVSLTPRDLTHDKLHQILGRLKTVPTVNFLSSTELASKKNIDPKYATHIVGAEPSSDIKLACASSENIKLRAGIDYDHLSEILSFNQHMLAEIAPGAKPETAVIAIVDSGLDGYGTEQFPKFIFDSNLKEAGRKENVDDDGNSYEDDVIGTNISTKKGFPNPFHEYKNGDHGTHVAGLAIGGVGALQGIPELQKHIRLKVINIMSEVKHYASDEKTGKFVEKTTYKARIEDLYKGIDYASKYANIANVSYGHKIRPHEPTNHIAEISDSLLIIAAAGNSGNLSDNYGIGEYPANFGGVKGSNKNNVISVAAHDANFELLSSSNYSVGYIDLTAPGCSLLSYTYDNKTKELSGTSQASPNVSLGAGLVYSAGVKSPSDIKARIFTSVDHHVSLMGSVASGGALNIHKALDIYRDRLTLKNNNPLSGEIKFPSIITCNGDGNNTAHIDRSQLRQILPDYGPKGETKRTHLIYDGIGDGVIERIKCVGTNLPDEIEITTHYLNQKSTTKKVPLSEIVDVVRAIRGPYSST